MALAWNAGWVNSPQGFESPILRQKDETSRSPRIRTGRFCFPGPRKRATYAKTSHIFVARLRITGSFAGVGAGVVAGAGWLHAFGFARHLRIARRGRDVPPPLPVLGVLPVVGRVGA